MPPPPTRADATAAPRATVVARRGAAAVAVLALAALSGACAGGDTSTLACPLLAPGATSTLASGRSVAPGESAAGNLGRGELGAHAIALAADQKVEVTLRVAAGRPLLFTYGPRDGFGGFPHCGGLHIATAGDHALVATLEAAAAGEYLLVPGDLPGDTPGDYELSVRCVSGCEAAPTCPTLSSLGCADVRCDGELARDEAGCLNCACDPGALCGPDRAAGPAGSCVLPSCLCPEEAAPVCGSDGQTWRNACEARCGGVAPVKAGACEIACPALAACSAPCAGLRAVGADGCPTCDCLPDFAADAASCAACPTDLAPVCGSDGVTYPGRCEARCAGARVLYAAACMAGCAAAPTGCELDCPWGLRLGGDSCLSCECAAAPTTTCSPSGAPVCVTLPGRDAPTTVGSPCLAVHLGAVGGAWGPCGTACGAELPCPSGSHCATSSFLAGRCLADDDGAGCGCSAVVEPVCGADGQTWDNACFARCAGVAIAKLGPCCDAAIECEAPETPTIGPDGCLTLCGAQQATTCAANAATAPACAPDGASLGGSACAAHAQGAPAAPGWCTP